MSKAVERFVVPLGALYVVALGWAMTSVSYDIWGAFVVLPLLVLASLAILRRVFADESRGVYRIAVAGLAAKLGGCIVRYWLTYDAYGGLADSESYHLAAKALAGDIRGGAVSWTMIVPSGTDTAFISRLTSTIYTIFGSSRLAGFFIFGWMAYCGALLFVRAAMIAVPDIARSRYVFLVLLSPSLLYWPSSIGKEAWMMLTLGLATLGMANVFVVRRGRSSILMIILGIVGAGAVRTHFAAIWVGAFALALIVGLLTRRVGRRSRGRLATATLLVAAVVGAVAVGAAALRYLGESTSGESTGAVTDQVSKLFDKVGSRTTEGGSSFEATVISGPQDWPLAIVRTLTRPLLNEAHSFAELIPAVEMTALLVLAAVSWRRLFNVFHMMRRCPYVILALVVLVVFGLAFSSFGNLAILTRQRSLVMPFFMVLFCLPLWRSDQLDPFTEAEIVSDGSTAVGSPSTSR